MKVLVTNYTFNAAAKTITFGDYANIALKNVLIITNVTDGIIIYNFADPTKGGSAATNVLSLAFDTTSMSNSDELQIYYDDTTAKQAVSDGGGSITVDNATASNFNTVVYGYDGSGNPALSTDATGAVKLAAGTNTIGKLGANSGTDIGDVDVTSVIPGTGATNLGKAIDSASGTTDTGVAPLAVRTDTLATLTPAQGDYVPLRANQRGALWTGEENSFSIKTAVETLATNVGAALAQTAGGATPYKLVSAATTNATNVKPSAGQLYGIQVYNTNAAARYLKLYNKATAPTVGTDTPVKVITIPGNTAGAGSNVAIPSVGVAFSAGIAFAITTGAADSDTGAVAANEIVVNLDYK